jgi:hypothetical protein
MRFRLRTLMIVLAVGPMLLAGTWFGAAAIVRSYTSPYGNTAPYGNYVPTEKDRIDAQNFDRLIKQVQEYEPNPEFSKADGITILRGEAAEQPIKHSRR